MAKKKAKVETKTIEGAKTWEISELSENTVWTYGNNPVSLKFQYTGPVEPKYEKISGSDAFIRQGNDLVLLTFYEHKGSHSVKKITNTIKNYFSSDKEVGITTKIGSNEKSVDDLFYTNVSGFTWDTSSTSTNLLYGSKKNDSYHSGLAVGVSIIDEAGKDTYDIRSTNSNGSNNIYDMKGNDTYYLASTKTNIFADAVRDYAGNDKYKITDGASIILYDYKGKDNYEISKKGRVSLRDYAGNDKYTLDDMAKGNSVTDYAGNDSYVVSNITGADDFINLDDHKGNDKYKYENVSSDEGKEIYDRSGKDTYNISGCDYLTIKDDSDYDKKVTNDTYNISNSSRIYIKERSSESGKKIASGNDTYNFNGVDNTSLLDSQTAVEDSAGNDKYNIKNSTKVKFQDNKGNDTWNLTFSKNITVTDGSNSKDKWNIVSSTSAENYKLTDILGNDTWTIKNSKSIYTVDKDGSDKYTISDYSNDIHITDKKGNDTYNIKDSTDLSITDENKSNDKYTFNNYTASVKNFHEFNDDGGNDSYSINNSRNAVVVNGSGNTTYTVNNSRSTDIADSALSFEGEQTIEKNTFNIKNSSATIVMANAQNYNDEDEKIAFNISNDTYNVTSSKNAWMYDYDFGNDTYNIKSNQGGTIINDKGGDDKYTVDKLTNNMKLADGAGNDTLTLSKTKADNLVFMANYDLELEMTIAVKDASLYVFDKSTKGYIQINNFYSTKTDTFGRTTIKADEKGTGFIENIVAGKKNVNSMVDTYTTGTTGEYGNLYLLGQEINSWLDNKGYSTNTYKTVGTILSSEIADEFLTFVSQYKPAP